MMAKKVKKKPTRTISPSMDLKSDLRAFLVAHPDRIDEQALKDLTAYIEAYYKIKLGRDELEALLKEEKIGMEASRKAYDIEKTLFTSPDHIYLGSCFCPACTRFKSYRKECPFCGHHEMTI
ncbi:MAG: hypothetical protein ACMUHM_02680 [Thermoplasmatota archaeon]